MSRTTEVSPDGMSATFTPAAPLQPLTSYTVQINTMNDLVRRPTSFGSNSFTTGAEGAGAGLRHDDA